MADIVTLALAYAAGALSTLSPCVLPILPLVLFAAVERHALGPLALAGGLAVTFAVLGIGLATAGLSLGIDGGLVRGAVAVLMILAGAALLLPRLQAGFALAAGPVATGGQALVNRITPSGPAGQFLLGAALAAVWAPCTGPTLGAAVGLAAQGESLGHAAAVMGVFGLGAATPLIALAYGSRRTVLARRDRLASLSETTRPLMGALLVATGLLVLTGLDKRIETALIAAMPEWLLGLTVRF